ncbi:MAG TPA: prepilin-type N-terminal cleavage/methylation domain-containing protein [Candidatus Dormibacteraeota bacterium]|nr:prepilin-type N-terminal cleavage/methylation domain-containing protein [Candidatus Dormibacteraeota bacterium]
MKRKQSGFSLIELLIVVAIILILAAIAIPNLIMSKMTANEASAVQTLRDINTAESVYIVEFGTGFSPDLPSLGGTSGTATPSNALLIPDPVAQVPNTKDGFGFAYVVTANNNPSNSPSNYTVNANPTNPGTSGRRWFFTDETMVIRANSVGPATANDPSI